MMQRQDAGGEAGRHPAGDAAEQAATPDDQRHDERDDERHDERLVETLRTLLLAPAALPAGLVARLHAGVSHARREAAGITPGQRVLLSSIVFTALAFGGNVTTAMVAFGAAVAYGFVAERVLTARISEPGADIIQE